MQAVPLTDDVATTIIQKMQEYYDTGNTHVVGWVCQQGGQWVGQPEVCHAPCVNHLMNDEKRHPDHFGMVYHGYGKAGKVKQNVTAPEALLWIEHLVNPEGPFKDVLPHLYHTDAKQIIEDRGVVIKDALASNAGLLWTFIQATRLMFEVPTQMVSFLRALEHDPQLALFMAMCVHPVNGTVPTGPWTIWPGSHCNPLGHQNYSRAHNFLNGKITPRDMHATGGSYMCFGEPSGAPNYYAECRNYPRPFEAWCDLFLQMKADENVKVTAYRA